MNILERKITIHLKFTKCHESKVNLKCLKYLKCVIKYKTWVNMLTYIPLLVTTTWSKTTKIQSEAK